MNYKMIEDILVCILLILIVNWVGCVFGERVLSKFLCYGSFVYVVVFYDDDFYIEFVIL